MGEEVVMLGLGSYERRDYVMLGRGRGEGGAGSDGRPGK